MGSLEQLVKLDPLQIGVDYQYLNDSEVEDLRTHLDQILNDPKSKPSQEQWNAAWKEVLDSGKDSPKYLNSARINIEGAGVFRWNKKFIKSKDALLEKKYHQALLETITDNYLSKFKYVVEFGCGTGHNLDLIRNKYPDINVYGGDFAKSSQDFLSKIDIKNFFFDMKTCTDEIPQEIIDNRKDVAVLTMGSLEQLGTECQKFISFLRELDPGLVINVEPVVELYDQDDEYDQLAITYHKNRNYLDGYFSELQNQSLVSEYCRTTFGNTYNEGFMVIKWK